MVYPTQERVVELQQIKFRRTMKAVPVESLCRSKCQILKKKSCFGLKLLSLILGMSHLQNPVQDVRSGDVFLREFSYICISMRKNNAQGII